MRSDGSQPVGVAMVVTSLFPLAQAVLLPGDVRDMVIRALFGLGVLGAGIWLMIGRERLAVDDDRVVYTKTIGPFRYSRRFARAEIRRPRIETFSFDPWDPHVAVDAPHGTIRVGWGYPEAELRQMVADLAHALGEPPTTPS